MEKCIISEACTINPPKIVPLSSGEAISFIPMDAVSTDGTVDLVRTISVGQIKNYSCFQNGDVLFAKITPCMENGKGAVVSNLQNGYGAGSTEFIVLRPNVDLQSAKWLFYYLSQKPLRMWLRNHMTGSAGQKRVPPKFLAQQTIPLPSLPEQQRIVFRIEELFSQLDSGVETLRKTKQQLAVYRQAVLKEAFSDLQEKRPIREVSSIVTSGSRGWAQYYADNGARFIRITDLTRDRILLKNDSIQYVDLPESVEGKRSRLLADDVLISITADLGSIALVPKNIPEAYINQHIAMVRFHNTNQGEFMAWYLKSEHGQKDLLKNKRGGGKLGLGLDDIRDTPVPVVDDEKANKIIELIDRRLSICDSIEQTVDAALQQAEAMRQSILKQAFEGEL